MQHANLLCHGLILLLLLTENPILKPKQQITLSMLIKMRAIGFEKLINQNQNLQVPQVNQQPETFEAHHVEKSPSYPCSVESLRVVSMNN